MSKKNLNMDKIKFYDPVKLRGVADKHVGLVRVRATAKGLDYKGQQFPRYSKSYAKLLSKDFRKKDGSRYSGYVGQSLTTSGAKRSKHLFELRGDTMSAMRVISVKKDRYSIGWKGEAGAIILGNAKRNRNLKDGIPDDEMAAVVRMLEELVGKEFRKIPNKTRIVV